MTIRNVMMEYGEDSDQIEYAQHQMKLHKAICARARGENIPLPVKTKVLSDKSKIRVPCMYCGDDFNITADSYKGALRDRGGACCAECRNERSGRNGGRRLGSLNGM